MINSSMNGSKYIVLYSCVVEEDNELYVDLFFFGGTTKTKEEAEDLAKSITNDRNINGVIVPKVYQLVNDQMFPEILRRAHKYFNTMAIEMYDTEERRLKSKSFVE